MKGLAIISLTLALLTIIGCSTTNHIYSADGKCITCWNNPITGSPINHDGRTNQVQFAKKAGGRHIIPTTSTSFTEYKVSFSVPVNIDVVFVIIKKEFQYQTEQEIRHEWGALASTKIQTVDFAYDAVPSTYYHMRAARIIDGQRMNIDSYIEKQAVNQTLITVTYWPRNTSSNAQEIGAVIKQRMISVLISKKSKESPHHQVTGMVK